MATPFRSVSKVAIACKVSDANAERDNCADGKLTNLWVALSSDTRQEPHQIANDGTTWQLRYTYPPVNTPDCTKCAVTLGDTDRKRQGVAINTGVIPPWREDEKIILRYKKLTDTSGSMKRILIADVAEGRARAIQALGQQYELVSVEDIARAETLLKTTPPDLVICGVNFDESRMLELLKFMRDTTKLVSIPFIALADNNSSLHFMSKKLLLQLGATDYVSTTAAADADVEERLRQAVSSALGACTQDH